MFVHDVCPRRLFKMFVQDVCPRRLSKTFVQDVCSRRLSKMFVQDICPRLFFMMSPTNSQTRFLSKTSWMSKSLVEQTSWTNILNKHLEQTSWTNILNKRLEQTSWTNILNKCLEQMYTTNDLNKCIKQTKTYNCCKKISLKFLPFPPGILLLLEISFPRPWFSSSTHFFLVDFSNFGQELYLKWIPMMFGSTFHH